MNNSKIQHILVPDYPGAMEGHKVDRKKRKEKKKKNKMKSCYKNCLQINMWTWAGRKSGCCQCEGRKEDCCWEDVWPLSRYPDSQQGYTVKAVRGWMPGQHISFWKWARFLSYKAPICQIPSLPLHTNHFLHSLTCPTTYYQLV